MTPFTISTRHVLAALMVAAGGALVVAAPAGAATSRNVTLLAHLDNYNAYSACWSYVHSDGREYAILGTDTGTSIVNITNPASPYEVAFIPGLTSAWREMKQYRSWIYITTEATGGGVQIVRMTDPEHPVLVKTYATGFNHEHTVAVDTTHAWLILNGTRMNTTQAGMRVLSLADPENPLELGYFVSDYVHDSWARNDTIWASCISSATFRVFDFSDPGAPVEVASWTYPGARTHSSDRSIDGRYLYVCDEQNYGTMKVFDVGNLAAHPMVREITVNPLAIVHNVHVKRDTAFVSYYTEGVRLFDLADPSLPAEWGYYDTYGSFSGGFHGVWEVAPYFPSGTFIASDIESGLYIFRATPDYGTVKVTVRDPGSSLLSGVDVVAFGEAESTRTQGLGTARLALSPGSHMLRFRKWGYKDLWSAQSVAKGVHTSLDATLEPDDVGVISGYVLRASDSVGLADATIEEKETPLAAVSGIGGTYVAPGVPPGTHRLLCDRPGYAPTERLVTMQPGASMTETFRMLRAAWYDSCDTDKGWSLSAIGDNAIDGLWVRAKPIGSSINPAAPVPGLVALASLAPGGIQHDEPGEGGYTAAGPVQPGDDYTPGSGFCFVTGNGLAGGDPNNGDVDGGRTTLTTPPLAMMTMFDPTIAFRRWYYMNTPGEPDSMLIDISSDGVNWVRVGTIRESHPDWHLERIRVKDYIVPSNAVRMRFIAQDEGVGTIVEAAVDDFETYDAALVPGSVEGGGPPVTPAAVLEAPRPNPAHGDVAISLRLRDAGPARVAVYDVAGRRVTTLYDGIAPAVLNVIWNGKDARGRGVSSGVYWVRAEAVGEVLTRRLVRVR